MRQLTLIGLILGALWAAPIVYLSRGAAPPEAILLACRAAGVVGGGALALAAVWQAALIFTLAVTIPLAGNLIWIRGPHSVYLAALALALGVRMTAKGVETEEPLARLFASGRNEAQGYLFSRPLSARDIADFLGSAAYERRGKGLGAVAASI